MKAACIMDRGRAVQDAKKAIMFKEGQSSVDLRGITSARLKLLEKGGWCPAYAEAKLEYQSGQVRVAGAMVMSPFRLYATGGGGRGFYLDVPGRYRSE
jgi:hypothetical protein